MVTLGTVGSPLLNMFSGFFIASSPDITLIPSATERTCIMRGSDMYDPNLSGFFCTSVSIAMKSGCERNPRVAGFVASLP